ncbi:TPA: hypothetical protein ACH3X1_016793 [Trebouxia sp. C0004]
MLLLMFPSCHVSLAFFCNVQSDVCCVLINAHHCQHAVQTPLLYSTHLIWIAQIWNQHWVCFHFHAGHRAGFFLGDGAGVGKGRQIAAMIKEEHARGGSRTLWLSVSNDLRFDAERDLADVGADNISVFPQGSASLPKGCIDKVHKQGVMFITYSLLIASLKKATLQTVDDQNIDTSNGDSSDLPDPRAQGVLPGTRLFHVVEWLAGRDRLGNCLIILDECHKAKNLIAKEGAATQTGKAVGALQDLLPNARVLYSSATGASEPNNLGYMYRLGAAGFDHMKDMIETLNRSGLGALELFAMGLKATGSYLSRTLSYDGAEFSIARVEIDPTFGVMYDRSTDFWQMLFHICSGLTIHSKHFWSQFFGAQMRFYRQMLMASKVRECAKLANDAVASGLCCVIGLQSTGEANTNQAREEEGDVLDDFVSAPKRILQLFLSKHFPTDDCDLAPFELDLLQHQVSQAVNAWRELADAAATAAEAQGATRPSQDIRATVGMTGVTTVNARLASPSAVSSAIARSAAPSAAPTAPAADDNDSDDGLELVGEQTLDEVLAERRREAERSGRMIDLTEHVSASVLAATAAKLEAEQNERDEAETQKNVDKAVKPYVRKLADAEQKLKDAMEALAQEEQESAAADPPAGPSAGKPCRKAIVDSDSEAEAAAPSGSVADETADAHPCTGSKRRSPHAPASQPVAKKGRLLKQSSSGIKEEPMTAASDAESMDEVVSPARKRNVDTDDEDFVPGSAAKFDVLDLTADTACERCHSAADADNMLLCDKCNRGYHTSCLSPPMEAIPEGDWFCQRCDSKRAQLKGKGGVPTARKAAAPRALMTDSDSDRDDFQALPPRPAGRLTARQGTLAGVWARQNAQSGNPAVRKLAAQKKVEGCEALLEQAKQDLERAGQRARMATQEQPATARSTRAGKAASSSEPAVTPAPSSARVKPEPGTASAAAAAGGPPSTGARQRELGSKSKRTGGSRDGYAVRQIVLDDDWEEELEDEAEDLSGAGSCPQMVRIRGMLLRLLDIMELPPNPLDQLTDLMGGEEKVAEMTGRKGLLRRDADGTVNYHRRCPEESQKLMNVKEKQAFMEGRKLIAIISDAASVGISLQADKRVANQRRRCHLTLELPWSADKAIQQFGRSHRSNQTSAPIYRIVVSACAGEYRFASSAAKRLQSLGALLKGDRRALGAGEDLKSFDVDTKWGKQALDRLYGDVLGISDPMPGVQVPHLPAALKDLGADGGWPRPSTCANRPGQDFFRYMRSALTAVGLITKQSHVTGPVFQILEKNKKVTKFLNRMLAMSLRDQKMLFAFFSDTLDACIELAKTKGKFENGIVSLLGMQSITCVSRELLHVDAASDARTYYSRLQANHGMDFAEAKQYRDNYIQDRQDRGVPASNKNGMYISSSIKDQGKTGHTWVLLATEIRRHSDKGPQHFRIHRPNNVTAADMQQGSLMQAYRRCSDATAKKHWDFWYNFLKKNCTHGHNCSRKRQGQECYTGTSVTTMHMVHGAVLPIWKVLSDTVIPDEEKKVRPSDMDSAKSKDHARVVRLKLDSGEPIIGLSLMSEDVFKVLETVEERFGQVDEALQQADTREWEQRNEQRRLAAASQSTTPAKGAAAPQQSVTTATRLLQQSPCRPAQHRSTRMLYHSPPPEIIELD